MSAAAFRLLSFVALATAAAALWVAFVHSTGGSVTVTPAIPPVGSQSIFVPSTAAPSTPGGRARSGGDSGIGTAVSSPVAPGLTVHGVVTNHACPGCVVRVLSGGVVRAQVPAGAGQRQAYALLDLGDRAADGRVLAHDVIAFGRGESPTTPLSVLQLLDSSRRLIFELVARPSRRLYLHSPPGGLSSSALDLSTGATVPNDGISGVAVDVSAKANGSLAVYVNGVRTISEDALAGARTSPPRFLATGVVRYSAARDSTAITATHTQVSVSTTTTSAASPVVVAPAPTAAPAPTPVADTTPPLASLSPPTISGRGVVGSTLTADPGSWKAPAPSFSFTWQRCDAAGACTAIDGATGPTYKLVRADRDQYVRVRVLARSGDSTGVKTSAAVGPVMRAAPSALAPPQISGEPVVGTPLSADAGTWSDPAATFRFAWQRCDATGVCTTIDGATGPTYTPVAADVGSSLRVEVTASNAGGAATVDSGTTGTVLPAAPAVVTPPTVAGDTTVGSALTADPGTWSDPAATLAYAWQRCDAAGACTAIAGAAGRGCVLPGADVGFGVAVSVTATNAGGSAAAASVPTAPVRAPVPVPPAVNGVPSVAGDPSVGSTLTADPGSWSDPTATFAYAWQRCDAAGACTTIDGATGSSYLLTAADVGARIRVEVAATGVRGTLGTADSAPVGPVVVPAPPAPAVAPSVSGDATVGSTLTADPGSWSGPPPTLSYAWQSCDDHGTCTAIDGADGPTYTLTEHELGRAVRVEVTATNAGGSGTADSAPTAQVTPPPPPTVLTAPSVGGDATVGSKLTADPGTWSEPSPSPSYGWQRCDADGTCATIPGAAGAAYRVTGADLGHRLRVQVTVSGVGGTGVAVSAATDPVGLPDPPSVVDPPGLSGDATEGSTLTTDPGRWTGAPVAFSYMWQRCDDGGSCVAIAHASAAAYTLSRDDVGHRIRVQVTAGNGGGSGTAQSSTTTPVAAASHDPSAGGP